MVVTVVGRTTLIWEGVVLQSAGYYVEFGCGNLERACICVSVYINTLGHG